MWVLVDVLVTVGMLVVVPGGLRLLGLDRVARVWPVAAVAGVVSLWLPRGPVALGFAIGYGVAAVLLWAYGIGVVKRGKGDVIGQLAVLTALVSPSVAASALIAERGGFELFGFEMGVLALTVAHFHFAGFAAALIAGLHRSVTPGRWADAAALTVPAGTLLVLVGYFVGEFVELAGAVVLTGGMWIVGWLTWRQARSGRYDRGTSVLLGVSGVVLAASMVLAVSWALGEATGIPHPSLGWMAATHGVANALGFAVCGIVGWRRAGARPCPAVEVDPRHLDGARTGGSCGDRRGGRPSIAASALPGVSEVDRGRPVPPSDHIAADQ